MKLDQRFPMRVSKQDLELMDALGDAMLKSSRLTDDEKAELRTLDGKVSRSAVMRWCMHKIAKDVKLKLYVLGKGYVPYE